MKVQYIRNRNSHNFTILDIKTLLGITYDDKNTYPTSCRRGIPLRITKNDYVTQSDEYSYIELSRRDWNKINQLAEKNDLQSSREILREIEKLAENAPQFIQERNDTEDRIEYQVVRPAA